MSQRIIRCPKCGEQHKVECFHSGGEITHMATIARPTCDFATSNRAEIAKLAGLEYIHEQRVRNMEMPATDECELEEEDYWDGDDSYNE